jgi:hypothetical protein
MGSNGMAAAERAAFTLTKRAAGGQGFARPRGPVGHQSVTVTNNCETTAQFDFTKWPRRFCCQQVSLLSVQNGFSLPKLTVLSRSAAMPSDER